jgi:PAS domain S-box-containing protein
MGETHPSIESIRDSAARFKAVFENASVGMARVSTEGRYLEVNQRLCDFLGYSQEELLTKTFAEMTHVDDLPVDLAELRRLLAGEISTYLRQKRYYRKDGSVVWGNLNVSLLRKADGSPDYFVSVVEDISARRHAEEKLRESEERFRNLADTAPVMIWIAGTDKLCTFFNKRWLDFTGRPMEKELGNGWTEGLHPGDYKRCLETYVGCFEARQAFEMEYRLRRYDGNYRWLLDHGIPRISAGGDFLGYIGSCIDITERREIEEALRESESRFRQLAESLPQLVWTSRADGWCDYLSPQWVAYTGIPESEQLGLRWLRMIHPDDRDRTLAAWNRAIMTATPFDLEFRLLRNDGAYRWFKTRAVALRDSNGKIIKWFGSNTDIDDQKQVHKALRESQERLEGIVSSAMDAIITVDDNQYVILFNEAAERMFGCRATEVIGQPLDRFIPERFRHVYVDYIRSFGESDGPSRAMGSLGTLSALRGDGAEFPVEASISNVKVGGSRLYTVILRDITERKRAEEEREQLALEQAARASAEGASRSKDEFLAMVSHELRSPLNAILGYTRILRSGPDRIDMNKATAVIERSAKAQLQIIEDLLDSARIIAGKLRIEPGPIDLVHVLQGALDTVRAAAEMKGVTLVATFGQTPEVTFGDSTRLQQVVWNLLSNAIKFTPQGGRVELGMESDANLIRITVSDTGKGIEPEFLPFVFDRFRQADSSSARRYGGLGLGLSLVKHLVELHGGTISAKSLGGGSGSMFIVTLPRREQELIPPTPAVASREVRREGALVLEETLSLDGVNVLVVDDQEEARVVLSQTLREYGAQVTAVSSGSEALALLSSSGARPPDVFILDIAMPDEDGYTVLKKVRALESALDLKTGPIPAIALTAFGRSEDRLHALQAGFNMHVAKPVEPAELALVIASLTNRRPWEQKRKE